MIERALAYDIGLDERKPVNATYIKRQVETHVGERLNVLLSRTRYELKEGVIVAQDSNEPFLDVIERGIGRGKTIDLPRENAELTGFLKTQRVLGQEETPIGTMMLSISLKGSEESSYQHNFYDIFTLLQDQDGRFIEARRYSSALSHEDYAKILGLDSTLTDAYFLAHPIRIYGKDIESADDIHRYFHKAHEYLSEEDFKFILAICQPFIMAYIKALSETDDRILHELTFNAVLNRADKAREDLELLKSGRLSQIDKHMDTANLFMIQLWGMKPVRQTMTGCGQSGGFSIGLGKSTSPFSVSEFGEDKFGSRTFECPECGKKNIRPENQLVKNCQHCGSSKVAC